MPVVKERIPLDFVRKFLSAKGYKMLHEVWCFDCPGLLGEVFPEHPMKWLWEHILMGHEPSFDCCHSWDRGIGRYSYTGEKEEWYRWFTFTWSKEKQDWIVTDTYQGCEGFEEPSPAWCWRR